MKFKFRAEPKDWAMFGIFAIFLLFISCLIVLNLARFSETGTFHGLNPFPAFTPKYFAPTMVVFIGVIIALITGASSLFFDREKGLGFLSDKKKEDGYSRWATEKEMKKELSYIDPHSDQNDVAGIPLIINKKGVWVDNGGYHNLIIGSTGAGKTQTTIFPMVKNLSRNNESMIITDPKGEIYEDTAEMLRERGYNIVLLNFRTPQEGNAWNPMTLPYKLYTEGNQDKATELLDDLALNILYDESSKGQDPFWEKTSADYFAGLSQALFEDASEEQINLNSINLMTTVGEDKFMGTTYMKEYFSYKDPTSPAYINVASTINAPNETKGSILSVFRQKIKLFATRENLSEMLARSDFDMKDIGRKKTAVFIVIQDEKKTYHSLVTIFLKQCYETLISVAQESGGKLPHRTNFILDEFANMPPLKDVTTMVTAARSRNIRFNFVIQNFAQLYDVYGKENGETIKGNCGNIVYLISSELSALEEISKMCGEVKSKEKEKTTSTPLVTVSDLQRLDMWNIIVLRIRMMPFKTVLTPNFEMDWGKEYPKAPYPKREKAPVQIFDLKKLVEEKKEAKVRELLGTPPSSNPAGGGSLPNPFMPKPEKKEMPNPFMPKIDPNPTTDIPKAPNKVGNLDVDELIKKIDAKIAALEEEERLEKEKLSGATKVEEKKPEPEPIGLKDVQIPSFIESKPTPVESVERPVEVSMPVLEPQISIPEMREPEKPEVSNIFNSMPVVDVPKPEPITPTIPTPINQPVQTVVPAPTPEPVVMPTPRPVITEPQVQTQVVQPAPTNTNQPSITDDQFFDDFFDDE
jgi:Type IV secretory pathway, VirD4 components